MSTAASADGEMTVRRFTRHPVRRMLAAGMVTCSFALSGFLVLGAGPAAAAGPTITGSGSSYAAVAMNQWVAQVAAVNGDGINYQTSSSVTGLNEFAQEQVDFGATEIGYSTNQANYTPPAGYAYQYLPTVAGATCMDYNVNNPIGGQQITNLQLTTAQIMGIFTGTITRWSQLAAGGQNAELASDNNPIITVFRTDPSGENYILSDYLNTIDPTDWAKYTSTLNFPGGAQAVWPFPQGGGGTHPGYDFSSWNGADGSDVASQSVYANSGSITYVETAYANLHHDPCAAVQNLPGDAFVQPSALHDATALLKATLLPDLEQLLTNVYTDTDPNAYAISAYSYLVTEEGQMNPARGAVLGRFIQFIACQGQQSAQQLGYSPLPPNLVEDDFQGITRINGAAAPPSTVNAATCNDPYVALFGGAAPPGTTGGTTGFPTGTTPGTSHGTTGGVTRGTTGGSSTTGTVTTNPDGTTATTGAITGTSAAGTTQSTAQQLQPGTRLPDGQIIGAALNAQAVDLLHKPQSLGSMLGWSLGFAALVIVPPSLALVRRRRRRHVIGGAS